MNAGTRFVTLLVASLFLGNSTLFGNGGSWPTGVPATGNGAPTDKKRSTNITIEEENLTIDLHQEFGAVEVRYKMRNTGAAVTQDFFFPVERWAAGGESEIEEGKAPDLENYTIKADATELKSKTIDIPVPKKEKAEETPEPSATAEPSPDASAE